ncbi:MAG: hypothetical protein BTN85_2083 [Candidatus Methanohalarchaeum thermophilum]|uniref:Uncharacterized protein n=1 Tax=Methanohalarchaeum thermophilum TaxID=1903181 RepID=A0A1Q6DSY2_METT1|nr:MAG: hypothetical protein BTN85_2083 [Candidatus Methanohalarchaeum thermophilum]
MSWGGFVYWKKDVFYVEMGIVRFFSSFTPKIFKQRYLNIHMNI